MSTEWQIEMSRRIETSYGWINPKGEFDPVSENSGNHKTDAYFRGTTEADMVYFAGWIKLTNTYCGEFDPNLVKGNQTAKWVELVVDDLIRVRRHDPETWKMTLVDGHQREEMVVIEFIAKYGTNEDMDRMFNGLLEEK